VSEERTLENPYTPTDNVHAAVAQVAVDDQAAGKPVELSLDTIPGMVAYFVKQTPNRTFTPDDIKLLASYAREILRQVPLWTTNTEVQK
jgi:hypothetical protein